MDYLIFAGLFLAVIGFGGVIYCLRMAMGVRKEADQVKAKQTLQKLVAWNFGALGIATIGLMVMVIGLVF